MEISGVKKSETATQTDTPVSTLSGVRIAICHPSSDMYGSDRMCLQSAKILQSTGCSVEVILPESGLLKNALDVSGVANSQVPAPVVRKKYLSARRLPRFLAGQIIACIKCKKELKQRGVQVLYVNTLTQPAWIAAAFLARTKVLVHVREAEHSIGRMLQKIITFPLVFSTRIVCNSRSTRDWINSTWPTLASKTIVVYNGKDWNTFTSGQTTSALSAREANIVVVGRLSPRKGQDVAIRALRMLADSDIPARLTLTGDVFPGYEWYEADLRALALDLQIESRVEFTGFVEDVASILLTADIAVVPSRIEPFGTVAAESMAFAIPTVVSRVDGLTEIVDSDEVGWTFSNDNPEELGHTLIKIIADKSASITRAEQGREHVQSRFSLDQYRKQLVHELERLNSDA